MKVPQNHIKQTKRHLCASGSILLPLAQKWRLVAKCGVLVASILPTMLIHAAHAASISVEMPSEPLTVNLAPNDEGAVSDPAYITLAGESLWGYTMSISSKSGSSDLMNGTYALHTIEGEKSSIEDFRVNTWGFKFSGDGITNNNFRSGPGNKDIELHKPSGFVSSRNYEITIGAKVDGTQQIGTYSGQFVLSITANTLNYNIKYITNTGSAEDDAKVLNMPSVQTGAVMEKSTNVKLSTNTPSWAGYTFGGWCDKETRSFTGVKAACLGTTYQPGANLELSFQNGDVDKKFWAIWDDAGTEPGPGEPEPIDYGDLGEMQSFDCDERIPMVNGYGTVMDRRDGKTYSVAKSSDGLCWMTQNLAIGSNERPKTLTAEDTDLNTIGSFELPQGTNLQSNFDSRNNNSFIRANIYLNEDHPDYGGYYNFFATTAGINVNSSKGGNAANSICPKGWHLPNYLEWMTVPSANLFQSISVGECSNRGNCPYGYGEDITGQYYSSTLKYGGEYAYAITQAQLSYTTNRAYYGQSVRCVAGESDAIRSSAFPTSGSVKSMQSVEEWGDDIAEGELVTARDERDENTYGVARLNDGKLWMVDNLRLGDEKLKDPNLTSATSDVPDGGFTLQTTGVDFDAGGDANADAAYIGEKYGGYYSWHTATAGTGTADMQSGNATNSICPKGWRLPSQYDLSILGVAYRGNLRRVLIDALPVFQYGGSVANDGSEYDELLLSPPNMNLVGGYWSSTADTQSSATYMKVGASLAEYYAGNSSDFSSTTLDSATISRTEGLSVRCIARIDDADPEPGPEPEPEPNPEPDTTKYMQNVADWGNDVKVSNTVTATDKRDNKTYTIARLKDNKLWMTQNLAIGSNSSTTTLTPENTDMEAGNYTLPAGTTTLAVDGVDGWNSQRYDTDRIYISPTANYGGYYTWYTATLGEGTSAMTSGETQHSVCPKGWRLPTNRDIKTLVTKYDKTSSQGSPGNFKNGWAGRCDEKGCPTSNGSLGYWWASTAVSNDNATYLYAGKSAFELRENYKGSGRSVRCVARG